MNSFSHLPNYKVSREDGALSHINSIVEFERNIVVFNWYASLVCFLEADVTIYL